MNLNIPPEHREAANFLQSIRPFDSLTKQQLLFCASKLATTYHRSRTNKEHLEKILDYQNPSLFVVRAGVFDVRAAEGDLIDRVSEGGFFGFVSLLTGKNTNHQLHVVEDGLLYKLDEASFKQLRNQSTEFDHFFNQAFEQRLRVGLSRRPENIALATPISEVMSSTLISVAPNVSIKQAAKLMNSHDIASLTIIDEQQQLVGIFTDKDCRKRVVAEGFDVNADISKAMTPKPISIDKAAMVHEATILMIRHQIKHLPVTSQGKPVSMITLSDLIRLQRSDPVLIISDIHRADSIEQLQALSEQIPELLLQLIKQDVRADDLGRILTTMTSTLTRHLITLAQRQLGTEPCPFVWLAFGSQGRQDQSAKSDQDNALLLDNTATKQDDAYFKSLAEFVNKGLDACGYIYCPGDIMAQNPEWRLSLDSWSSTFYDWITQPSQKALMHTSIFFDMRPIFTSTGAETLFTELQDKVLVWAQENSIFQTLLCSNALGLTPPLGFLKQLVVDTSGEQKHTFDIKKRGVMPINDIARIHSLAGGIKAVNTRDRLNALIEQKLLTETDGNNLLDALEFISHQRLIHQGEQLKRSQEPDNHLNPNDFSQLATRQLKDAFKVVRDAQRGLKLKYQSGLL
ncbi:MAG: cyclic nucleotide-binding/CBS domain-containing protein [Arenicella sp.]|nr:cyclic nucleotide-binding/CBS domain-containing protein [Arenicella sp.]